MVIGACCAGWVHLALAQASDLTLRQALTAAATVHPTVQVRAAEVQAAGKDIEAAKWGRFPTASVQATSSSGQPQAALVLQQPLWVGGKIDAQIRLTEAALLQAEAALHEARQNALLQTGAGFFEVLRLRARVDLARVNEVEHKKLLDLIDRRVKAEISPVADLTLARARMQQAISDRIQFDRALQSALLALDQWVGPHSGSTKAPSRMEGEVLADEQMVSAAKDHSGELRRLRHQVDVSKAQVDIAESNLWPGLYLTHRQSLGGPGYVTQTANSQTFLSLNITPGAGLSAASQAEAAKARMETARQGIDTYERQLAQQVRNTAAEWRALNEQQVSTRELVQATQDVVASYLRQYQLGRKNWLDVLNALRESVQAAYTSADIDHGLQSAQLRLMLYSGQLHFDNLHLIHD